MEQRGKIHLHLFLDLKACLKTLLALFTNKVLCIAKCMNQKFENLNLHFQFRINNQDLPFLIMNAINLMNGLLLNLKIKMHFIDDIFICPFHEHASVDKYRMDSYL